jgi:DNA-directed RNA polymerase subunit RPC12/RpoP
MNLTPVILGGLAGAIAPLVFFAYARKKKLQVLKGHKWGMNLSDIKCPKCGTPAPSSRIPKNFRQFMWGGWTCATCGEEFDKWLRPIEKKK